MLSKAIFASKCHEFVFVVRGSFRRQSHWVVNKMEMHKSLPFECCSFALSEIFWSYCTLYQSYQLTYLAVDHGVSITSIVITITNTFFFFGLSDCMLTSRSNVSIFELSIISWAPDFAELQRAQGYMIRSASALTSLSVKCRKILWVKIWIARK